MGIKAADREKWNKLEKNTVVLHHFQRAKLIPDGSPFGLKMETYLRMADIKYENDFKYPSSPKGKTPWITVNGKDVSDSQLAIEYLEKELEKSLNDHLKPEEAAVARAFQVTLDDRFAWCLAIDRLVYGQGKVIMKILGPGLPGPKFAHPLMMKLFKRGTVKSAHGHGIGRHSEEEVKKIALADLKAFSEYLGNKPFLFGEKPSIADASLFGFLAQILATHDEDNWLRKAVQDDYKNLVDYVERVKEKYWSDWEEEQFKEPPPKEEKKKDEADAGKDKDKKEEDKEEEKKEEEEKKDKEDGKEDEEKK